MNRQEYSNTTECNVVHAEVACKTNERIQAQQGLTGYMWRVGQNRVYTPYTTVYLMISLPEIPYIHRIYMVLANLILVTSWEWRVACCS